MRFGLAAGLLFAAVATQLAAFAQRKTPVPTSPVLVPFVGCTSVGQSNVLDAPKGVVKAVSISRLAAQSLAYYACDLDLGVLAPKGWHCVGSVGSGGAFLFVTPEPINIQDVFTPHWQGWRGPVIEISERHSDQFGDRSEKAEIIARMFPAHKSDAAAIMKGFDFPEEDLLLLGPYPTDRLTYRSQEMVEYRTPAETDGMGTHSSLVKNRSSIEGVVILKGSPPDLVVLSVRLPARLSSLSSVIVRQFEQEKAEHR